MTAWLVDGSGPGNGGGQSCASLASDDWDLNIADVDSLNLDDGLSALALGLIRGGGPGLLLGGETGAVCARVRGGLRSLRGAGGLR